MPASFLARILLWLWLGGAVAVGHFLVLQRLPPLAIPAISIVLAAFAALVGLKLDLLRAWIDSVDLRALVLLHVTRFAGIYFLSLSQQGEFPRALLSSNVVDVLVAMMALPIALAPLSDDARRRAIVIWNVVGFLGLLMSILAMARLGLAGTSELRAFTRLPLSLVPTMLIPLLLFIHVVIFVRTGESKDSRR